VVWLVWALSVEGPLAGVLFGTEVVPLYLIEPGRRPRGMVVRAGGRDTKQAGKNYKTA